MPQEPIEIDEHVPHASRVYDYLLGGSDNFAVDRELAARVGDLLGGIDIARADVRANRDFLIRAVRYLAGEVGLRQFLDIGTGVPNADNTHSIAQDLAPDSRIVYVDNDPIVLAHAHTLLESTSQGAAAYLDDDLRRPGTILQRAAQTLDFTQPVAITLISIVHFILDEEDPHAIVAELVDAVPSGSYLALTHLTGDIRPEQTPKVISRLNEATRETFTLRTHADISRFFDGLELIDPGLAQVDQWRPDGVYPPESREYESPFYGAVGRKP